MSHFAKLVQLYMKKQTINVKKGKISVNYTIHYPSLLCVTLIWAVLIDLFKVFQLTLKKTLQLQGGHPFFHPLQFQSSVYPVLLVFLKIYCLVLMFYMLFCQSVCPFVNLQHLQFRSQQILYKYALSLDSISDRSDFHLSLTGYKGWEWLYH